MVCGLWVEGLEEAQRKTVEQMAKLLETGLTKNSGHFSTGNIQVLKICSSPAKEGTEYALLCFSDLFYICLYLITQFWFVSFQPEYRIADPICTYVFSLLVAFTTFRIIWDTVVIILEGKLSGIPIVS